MIDIESTLPASAARKELLGVMADVRGTLALSLAQTRAFLLSGDPCFVQKLEALWTTNQRRFRNLQDKRLLLTREQADTLAQHESARDSFSALGPRMIEIRAGDEWNLAVYWLPTKAIPTASRIDLLLQDLILFHEQQLQTDLAQIERNSTRVLVVIWCWPFPPWGSGTRSASAR